MILIKEMMTNLQFENLPSPIYNICFYKLLFNIINQAIIFEYLKN